MAQTYVETPSLEDQVSQGKLPKIAERLPTVPLVDRMEERGRTLGKPGGELRMLMAGARDVRMMVVYGYARLVGYNEKYEIVPDILEKVDVEDGRVLPARVDQVLAAGNADPRAAATAGWASKGYALVRLAAPQGVDLAALAAGAPVGVKISRVSRASGAGSALQTVSAAGEARAAEAH